MTDEIKKRIEQVKNGKVPEGYNSGMVFSPLDWQVEQLSKIAKPIKEKAGNRQLETLSISAGIGFVNQASKFGKELSGAQYVNYTVLKRGDFSYNKGNSKRYPQGCVYMQKDREIAAVPNVFNSFRLDEKLCNSNYYSSLFINGYLNKQLYKYINSGVRNDGLLNLYDNDFYSCLVPVPPLIEQEKIAELPTHCDKVIELKKKLIAEERKQKKWLMQNLLTGKRRLQGFSTKWNIIKLKDICKKCTEKNIDFKYNIVFSNSARNGIIPQDEQFDKDIANDENINGYYVIHTGEFVYNPRISVTAPCGPINRNKTGKTGVLSPLYTVFTLTSSDINGAFLEQYFLSTAWFKYMKGVANYGARHDRMNITDDDFFEMPLRMPNLDEQNAIEAILSTADHKIELLEQELEQWQQKKKSLMQLLLTGIVRVNI